MTLLEVAHIRNCIVTVVLFSLFVKGLSKSLNRSSGALAVDMDDEPDTSSSSKCRSL